MAKDLPAGEASTEVPAQGQETGEILSQLEKAVQPKDFHEYTHDDGEKQVFKTADDLNKYLREGTQRYADYHKKRMADASYRRQLEQREKDFEKQQQTFLQTQQEQIEMSKFLDSRADVKDYILQNMRQPAPSNVLSQAQGYTDETSKKLEERVDRFEQYIQDGKDEKHRTDVYNAMAKDFPDFDKDTADKMVNELSESPDDTRALVELIHYAIKGKNNPIQQAITADIGKKQNLQTPVVSGGVKPDGGSKTYGNMYEAADAAKQELGL